MPVGSGSPDSRVTDAVVRFRAGPSRVGCARWRRGALTSSCCSATARASGTSRTSSRAGGTRRSPRSASPRPTSAGRLMARTRRRAGRRPHVAADPGDPHRRAGAARHGPVVDPGAPRLAPQRASLRRPHRPEQGRDRAALRGRPGEGVASQLRHPAAADRGGQPVQPQRRRALRPGAAGRAAPHRVPRRTSWPGCSRAGTS